MKRHCVIPQNNVPIQRKTSVRNDVDAKRRKATEEEDNADSSPGISITVC